MSDLVVKLKKEKKRQPILDTSFFPLTLLPGTWICIFV